MSLPAADELFRSTGGAAVQPSSPQEHTDSASQSTGGGAPRVPAPAGEAAPDGGESEEAAEEAAGSGPARSAPAAPGAAAPGAAAKGGDRAGREAAVPGQGKRSGTAGRSTGASSGRGAGEGERGRAAGQSAPRRKRAPRRPSGRERHDEKITVYVSAEELMDLEHARLVLRGEHGLAVDRGRIVREAVAVVLADLESRGDASILVRRLRGR